MKLSSLKKVFIADTQKYKANKSANDVILKLVKLCEQQKKNTELSIVDTTFNGSLNRGVVAECLIKALLTNRDNVKVAKSLTGADMIKDGVKYEIKLSTGKGYAHYNPKQNLDNLIFVNQYGVYLTSGKNIILDKCERHIKDIVINNNVKTLFDLSKVSLA